MPSYKSHCLEGWAQLPARQALQDQAFWMNFVLLGDECPCRELGRLRSVGLAGDGVCRFGKGWQEMSRGISRRLLQWGTRTGNAHPGRLFPAAWVQLPHRPRELRDRAVLSPPLALRSEW